MTDGTRQSARSRVAEAEKQLRIARQSLSERHPELADRLGEATVTVKRIGETIEAAETDGDRRSESRSEETHAR